MFCGPSILHFNINEAEIRTENSKASDELAHLCSLANIFAAHTPKKGLSMTTKYLRDCCAGMFQRFCLQFNSYGHAKTVS